MKNNNDHYHVNNSIYYITIIISMISNLFVTPSANLSIYLYPIFYSYEDDDIVESNLSNLMCFLIKY